MLTIRPRPYQFSAAHSLPNMPVGHKCRRVHGHTYQVAIEVGGELRDGMLPDYALLERIVARSAGQLDHCALNDIVGLENPTTELLALWLVSLIEPAVMELGARLLALEVNEGGHLCRWTRDA